MLTLTKVHDLQKVPGKRNEVRMVGEHHYVRIGMPGLPPIFVQDGQFYSEGGPAIVRQDLPETFWNEARKVTLDMRRTVGLVLPEELTKKDQPATTDQPPPAPTAAAQAAPAPATPAPAATVSMKTCEACKAEVPSKAFGSHMAKHARESTKGS